jgi:hypothetical protein
MAVYSIKGSAIRMKFEFVRTRFGAAAEAAMRAHFKGRRELEPLLDVDWVPFSLYEEIHQHIAATHYGGDLTRLQEVGAYAAERGLATTYKAWVRGKQLIEFLEQFSNYYPTFYNKGELQVKVGFDHHSATLTFRNAPIYTEAELNIAIGYFLGACQVMGLQPTTHHTSQSSYGMEIQLSWS